MARSKRLTPPRRRLPGHEDLKDDLAFVDEVARLAISGEIAYLDGARMIAHTVVARRPQRIATWVRKNLIMPAGKTGRPGSIVFTNMQAEIADLFQDPEVKKVTYLKGPRIGASFLIAACMIYFAAHENKPVMFYDRALKNARSFYEEKFGAIFQASDSVRHLLPDERASVDRQRWTDRTLTTGAGARFRSVSDKIKSDMALKVFADEAGDSAYRNKGASAEGSKIGLIAARAQEFSESTVFVGGTPTAKGDCTVSEEWEKSNKCEWVMAFSCCGCEAFFTTDVREVKKHEYDVPHGPGIRYTVDDRGFCDEAWYECGGCSAKVPETEKVALLDTGRWVPQAEATAAPGHVGVRSWAAHSQDPEATWVHIANEHITAVTQPDKAQHFVNLWLALPWEPPVAKSLEIYDLKEKEIVVLGGKLPSWIRFLFCGIDGQRGSDTDPNKPMRMEGVIYGVGANLRRHVVGHFVISHQEIVDRVTGEITRHPVEPFSWIAGQQVADHLDRIYETEDGRMLSVLRTCVDVGYEMEQATAWVRDWSTGARRMVPVRGASEAAGRAPAIGRDREHRSFVFRNGILVQKLGTMSIKDYLYDTLSFPVPGPQSWTFPAGTSDAFYRSLLAERLIELPSGRTAWRSKDKKLETGEVWDCLVYAYAAEMMEREWTEFGRDVMIPSIRISREAVEDSLLREVAKAAKAEADLIPGKSAVRPAPDPEQAPEEAAGEEVVETTFFEIVRDEPSPIIVRSPKTQRTNRVDDGGFVIAGRDA